jgi:CelD/BcsL family acetyltransferase involved in cellulose biosynthesis
MARCEFELIQDSASLEALTSEWWELWQADPQATPFQSPAWLLPWWDVFGAEPQAELATLAARKSGRLVGLGAFYIRAEETGRKLLPLGIGISDYLDPLLAPGQAAPLAGELLGAIGELAPRIDTVDLNPLPADSILLDAPPPPGWDSRWATLGTAPVLDLAAPDDGAAHKLRGRLGRLPYYERRAERLGPARVATSDHCDPRALIEALFTLHEARWRKSGEAGVLADPRVQRFHRAAAPRLARAGLLRLRALLIADRPAAIFYGLADRHRLHAYLGGWDPHLPHPGLGAMMIGGAIEAAQRERMREVHFLRGDEPYKYSWGAVDRPSLGLSLIPQQSADPSPECRVEPAITARVQGK